MKEFCPEWIDIVKEAEKGGFQIENTCPIAKYCDGECSLNEKGAGTKSSDKPDHMARSLAAQPNHSKHKVK